MSLPPPHSPYRTGSFSDVRRMSRVLKALPGNCSEKTSRSSRSHVCACVLSRISPGAVVEFRLFSDRNSLPWCCPPKLIRRLARLSPDDRPPTQMPHRLLHLPVRRLCATSPKGALELRESPA